MVAGELRLDQRNGRCELTVLQVRATEREPRPRVGWITFDGALEDWQRLFHTSQLQEGIAHHLEEPRFLWVGLEQRRQRRDRLLEIARQIK